MRKLLLVIDLQKEFENQIYDKCIEYINNSKYDLVVGTYFKNMEDSNFCRVLGWKECLDSSKDSLEYAPDQAHCKSAYAFHLDDRYKEYEVHVMGQDTDACVLATCFDLWDRGFTFKVLKEYTYSPLDVEQIYERNFGDCLI